MRPIKYKIWYPDSNLMNGPYDIDLFYIKNSAHPRFKASDTHHYLQYSGLIDKNGREIYEGDILTMPFVEPIHHDRPFIIEFQHGCFCLKAPWSEIKPLWDYRFSIQNFEVIGNIYQNPGLARMLDHSTKSENG
jgi:uncharacterized phage protein (TIGR01671 family)